MLFFLYVHNIKLKEVDTLLQVVITSCLWLILADIIAITHGPDVCIMYRERIWMSLYIYTTYTKKL